MKVDATSVKQKKPHIWWAILVYLAAAAIYCYQMWAAIDPAASSTAALGYLFAPISAAIFALPFAVMGFAIGMLFLARTGVRSC